MNPVAVALVIGSASMHAWWNARAHAGADRLAGLTIAYATGALILLPWLVADPPTEALALVAASGFIHAAYVTLLAAAYDRGSLATAYPLARGSAPLVIAVAGTWVLDQPPTMAVVVGAVVLGLGLIVVGGVAWGAGEQRALAFAVATGVMIASYSLVDARGVAETGAVGYFAAASAVAVLVMIVGHRQPVDRLRAAVRSGARIGLVQSTAYVLILLAYARADAGRVATLRGTSILFGLVLVRRAVNSRIVFGVTLVVVGAGLVVA